MLESTLGGRPKEYSLRPRNASHSKMEVSAGAILILMDCVQCANILFVGMYPSISHQSVFQPIWKELSLKGHLVTALTPNPIRDPSLINLTEIDLSEAYHVEGAKNAPTFLSRSLSTKEGMQRLFDFMENVVICELENPDVRALLSDRRKIFDVVIVEIHYPALFAFSTRFNCPLIAISSLGTFLSGHDAVGNPTHPGLYPDIFYPKMNNLSFWERLETTYYGFWFRHYYASQVLRRADEIAKRYFGKDTPYIGDIERNISLLFLNVNPILYAPRPNVPSIIHLGHMYIKSSRELSRVGLYHTCEDLRRELDDAREGVVYFSLGTVVKSVNLSLTQRDVIIKDLSELPYKVLWKWETDYLPGQPENVIIRKWVPQQAILAHRNTKAFVTQGGLQSMEEAIVSHVPMVGMPFIDDQPSNVQEMIKLGIATSVNPQKLQKGQLRRAILEVAENRIYRENIKEIASIMTDDFMTGLERAIWWTEYVIRHRGAGHLRSPTLDIPLHQYFLLDILGFTMTGVFLMLFVTYRIIKITINGANKMKKQ